jgi:AcrR family transcriptional regulator
LGRIGRSSASCLRSETEVVAITKATEKKSGDALGRKGAATRLSLLEAVRRLMFKSSPLAISPAAISKEAGTAAATFYVYFKDVEDILWTLCDSITQDTSHIFEDDSLLRVPERLEEDALKVVKAYSDIWLLHGPIMQYRNLEGDRGNARFNALLTRTGLPILRALTERIVAASPSHNKVRRSDANADAVVLLAAMDRIAGVLHLFPGNSLTPDVLQRAQARVLVRMLRQD